MYFDVLLCASKVPGSEPDSSPHALLLAVPVGASTSKSRKLQLAEDHVLTV